MSSFIQTDVMVRSEDGTLRKATISSILMLAVQYILHRNWLADYSAIYLSET